jgi:transcriptional regulator with XRE-family HTH domain
MLTAVMASKDVMGERKAARKETGRRLLVALRLMPHLSQAELARRVGIHPSSFSEMISGKRTTPPEKIGPLAKELRCSPASLLPGGPEPGSGEIPLMPVVGGGEDDEWPPGLRDFLERHHEDPRLNDRIRWYLINSRTRVEPWVKQDDLFWNQFTDFWVMHLAAREGKKH